MEIKERVRQNLEKAIQAWVAAGPKRSRRKAAELAKVNYDHLSKYLKPEGPGLDIDKIAAVCNVVGVQVSSLFEEATRTPDSYANMLPVISLSRIRAMDTPDEVVAEIQKVSTEKRPYPTNDPQAFWLDLDRDVGDYKRGNRALVSPSTRILSGDVVAAIPRGSAQTTIGIYSEDKSGQSLTVSTRERYTDFLVLGFVEFIGHRPNAR